MIHPAVRMTLYVVFVMLVPQISAPLLPVVLGLALMVNGSRLLAVSRVLWRMRWFFLVLLVSYGWSLPGAALWSAPVWLTPTLEGVEAGVIQALRLALLLTVLDYGVLSLEAERLLSGLVTLIAPLRRLGMDTERVTVRVALTLRVIEQPISWKEAMQSLSQDQIGNEGVAELPIRMRYIPLTGRDWMVMFASIGVLGGTWLAR